MDKAKKIFGTGYYKGLYLKLDDEFAVKILENDGRIVFGKLTMSVHDNGLSKDEVLKIFNVDEKYLDYFIENHAKFKVIWNVAYNNHKIGEVYNPKQESYIYPWNLICHHIGYYRRDGARAIDDAWKLGVKGLNPQIFKKFRR